MAENRKLAHLITSGVIQSLDKVPFHGNVVIKRRLMLSKDLVPVSDTHVAVHFIKDIENMDLSKYSRAHRHDVDEINLILSENDILKYEIQLEDETYVVSSPSTIYIPKGIKHSARALSGNGLFICIILSDHYKSHK